jgi:hypothetical protein
VYSKHNQSSTYWTHWVYHGPQPKHSNVLPQKELEMTNEPRKQTRRSISVCSDTYDRLKRHGAATNRSLSSLVEEAVETYLPKSVDGDARLRLIKEAALKNRR